MSNARRGHELSERMKNHELTLNIRYDIPESDWELISNVYKGMDGWLASDDLARWYGTEDDAKFIYASVEPGGIQFVGKIDGALWTAWIGALCARLSVVLDREIHDAEMYR
jgi:hypothetical protein